MRLKWKIFAKHANGGMKLCNRYLLLPFVRVFLMPTIKYIWGIVLGLIAFVIVANLYPYIPGVGGVFRNEFATQQLVSTIERAVGGDNYKVYKLDFLGFGEVSYLVVAGDYSHFYFGKNHEPTGTTRLFVFLEVQQNPIEKLLFSNKIYKKAFEYSFHKTEITFEKVVSYDEGKDQYYFCINGIYCGKLLFQSKFKIVPMFYENEDPCQKQIEYSNITLSKISAPHNIQPLIYIKKASNDLFVAFPNDTTIDHNWKSSQFRFCAYGSSTLYPYANCYVTSTRYFGLGENYATGDLADYFENKSQKDYYDDFMFKRLESCK